MTIWLLMIFGTLAAGALILSYNRAQRLRYRLANARHQIGIQLTRRHDLIPNLVTIAGAALDHERNLLTKLAEARGAAMAALARGLESSGSFDAEDGLEQQLHSVIGMVEAWPQLKANQSLLALQEELTTTENRIAFARQHYNDEATRFNFARAEWPQGIFLTRYPSAALWRREMKIAVDPALDPIPSGSAPA